MSRLASVLMMLVALLSAASTSAHEIRPAYLDINQTSTEHYRITWKQPVLGEFAVHLVPHLSNGWLERKPVDQYASDGFLIRTWQIATGDDSSPQPQGLAGATLTIEGLENTITDAFVRVRLYHGETFEAIVRPQTPSVTIELDKPSPRQAAPLLMMGIEHILSGPDHLLFVLGLLLIVRDRRMLLKTITGFTLAHSLTLGYATLAQVSLPSALIEVLISLSILLLAPEVMRARRGGTSFTIRYPWAVAFTFGLLHGLGFAGGLSAAGLERGQQFLMLVLFNAGVEVGQVGFIMGALALQWVLRRTDIPWPRAVVSMPVYLIGVLGAYWTFQCGATLFGWHT
jgi:hydrogenase/urease accessory protein HupE